MLSEDNKYYPSLGSRLQTIYTQIEENQKIYFRNDFELLMAKKTGGDVKRIQTEVDVNNKILEEKLDVLYPLKDELEKIYRNEQKTLQPPEQG